ncbi:hypothetical protein C1H46_036502 [Malus baccata]|uniref:Uncharacterized protein n=1 Tax=Malus baccata TaxID=106549 RepID=A0A540KV22_MALBA|nr:hypothetical protein C1H46_036502 [Malus baccata]
MGNLMVRKKEKDRAGERVDDSLNHFQRITRYAGSSLKISSIQGLMAILWNATCTTVSSAVLKLPWVLRPVEKYNNLEVRVLASLSCSVVGLLASYATLFCVVHATRRRPLPPPVPASEAAIPAPTPLRPSSPEQVVRVQVVFHCNNQQPAIRTGPMVDQETGINVNHQAL